MKNILNEIALDVYNSGWLEKECRKICPNDKALADDLMQEIFLIILTFKPAGALQKAYAKNEHLPFIKKIIMNQYNSQTSPFYKTYKKYAISSLQINEEITENIIEEYGD
jgi:hypothetical protein